MFRQTKNGVVIEFKVRPGAGTTGFHRGVLLLKAPPEQNKANRELIAFLRKLFGREVELVGGFTSRKKTVLVHNLSVQEAQQTVTAQSRTSSAE